MPGRLRRSGRVVRARRLPRPGCSWLTRRPPTHSGSPALAVPNAPARPGKEEGGAALPARAPPTTQAAGISGPRRAPQRPAPAAEGMCSRPHRLLQSGGGRGVARPRHGAPDLGVRKGETSRIVRPRGRMGTGTGLDNYPSSLRGWNVPDASRPPSPHTEQAAGGFPRAFPPACWGARLLRERARGRERTLLRRTRTGRPRLPPASAAAQFVWEFGRSRGGLGS